METNMSENETQTPAAGDTITGEPTKPTAQLSPGELWDQKTDEARAGLDELAAVTTQREWLQITTRLDRNRQQIGTDSGLTLLALAWVKEKRAHGGASWDRLLDMTDEQLSAIHDFPAGNRPDDGTTPDAGE
jgi:hypothetical protein